MEKYFNKKDMLKESSLKKRPRIEPNIDDVVADLGL